jgi:hypothetical protein
MAIIGIVRPNWGTRGMSLPLLLNSATLPLGEAKKISVDGINVCARRRECLILAPKQLAAARAQLENITGRGAA